MWPDFGTLAVRLTLENARTMSVADAIEAYQGHFFCGLGRTFDVIAANLPQEIIPPAYGSAISPLQSQAIEGGGSGGNAILLDFLDIVPAHMHAQSSLYVIVNTITDYRRTIAKIYAMFEPTIVWEGVSSTKTFVRDNIDFYAGLMEAGIVSLVEDGTGGWHAHQFIYRLRLKA